MRVLVACEESQRVCQAFRDLGHEAYSCDILPTSGAHPEWHIRDDVLKHLNDGWDMMIAHPPCTYLANSGVSHLYNKDGSRNEERWENMKMAAKFFHILYFSDVTHGIKKICVENPVMHIHAKIEIGVAFCQDVYPRKQVIQPWMFGHKEKKATCLWLVNLPPLEETDNVKNETDALPKHIQQRCHYMSPGPNRARDRARTYPGIARAMAEQWGGALLQAGDQHE